MKENLKVLHLEANIADGLAVEEVILQKGLKCEIKRVGTKDAFLAALNSFFPDIILSNYAVTNFTAEEALDHLHNSGSVVPFILVTSPVSEAFAAKMIRKGALDYFLKEDLQEFSENIFTIFKKFTSPLDERKAFEAEQLAVFKHSLDAVLITSPDEQILAANPAACKMFQMTEEELCREGNVKIVDTTDPSVKTAIKEREQKGKTRAEVVMTKKDGSLFDAEVTATLYTNDQGELRSVLIIRDVTERKRITRELKISQENYKRLFQQSPLPNWIYDCDTLEILDVNDAAVSHYGYSKEEFLQMNILGLRFKDSTPLQCDFPAIEDEETTRYGVFKHYKKDGSIISAEVFGYQFMLNNRKCRFVVGIDVTEKELFLKRLDEKRAKLQTAQEIAKLGYWEFSMDSEILYWTQEVYKIWEVSQDDFHPSYAYFLGSIHPDDRPAFVKQISLTLKGFKEELHLEHRIVLPNGKVKWVYERGKLFTNSRGKRIYEGTVQDITEQKTAIEKLQRSEARHRGILKSQTNYLIRTDLEGKLTYCNEKYLQDFNWAYENGDPVGKLVTGSIKEYHHEKAQQIFEECLANPNRVHQVEVDKITRNGNVKVTLWDMVCLTEGEFTEVQSVGIDITDRVNTEKLLKESNARYELVTRATSDTIWDWDLVTGKVTWGENFSLLFGPGTPLLQLESWSENLHPEDATRVLTSLNSFLKGTGNNWTEEYRIRKASGEYAYVIDSAFLLRDDNQRPVRMVGAMNDITERKKLEYLLDKASRLAKIGSFEYIVKTENLYWSPTIKEIFEVPENYVPKVSSATAFYEADEDREAVLEAFYNAITNNMAYEYEAPIITAKGKRRWVKVVADPEFVNGSCVRVHGSFQDINDFKRAEIEATLAFREKEIILESIGDAFFAVDKDWIVTYWNQHAEKLLDRPKEEILGKNLWDVYYDAIGTDFFYKYKSALQTKEIEHFEAFYDGSQKWFELTAYPSASGLSVYFKDITDKKMAALELQELNLNLQNYTKELVAANKGLEQFSYIVSHNLRSPVANIIGLASLLEEDTYPASLKETLLKDLLNNVHRLDTIIKDLNEILQVKGYLQATREEVVFSKIIEHITSGILSPGDRKQVQITTNFEVEKIQSVLSYFQSIFYNLITNSIKYRRKNESPKISIRTFVQQKQLVILYKDNGLGIDLKKKEAQVFGLYKRFHDHVEGKGMGLFMVKTQVDLLGGKIFIESDLNHGTEFRIVFEKISILENKNEKTGTLHSS